MWVKIKVWFRIRSILGEGLGRVRIKSTSIFGLGLGLNIFWVD